MLNLRKALIPFLNRYRRGLADIVRVFWEEEGEIISGLINEETIKRGLSGIERTGLGQRVGVLWGEKMRPYIERAFLSGGRVVERDVGKGLKQDPEVEDYINERGAEFVLGISESEAETIRYLLRRAYLGEISMLELKKAIKQVVGLTEREARWWMNRRQALLEAGLSPEEIEREMRDFAERLLEARAKRIARTELSHAFNEGAIRKIRKIEQAGYITNPRKASVSAGDERVCGICIMNESEGWIKLEADFPSGHSRPPFHPNCRCSLLFDYER